jgi:clan AA aspartic protease
MIVGHVNADREAIIPLLVSGPEGQAQEIDAIIDTGFTGFLSLPPGLVASLGLAWRGHSQAVLADGALHLFDVYVATVIWDGHARTVEADAADIEPVVGMGLIHGYELRIQAVSGGRVTLERLP